MQARLERLVTRLRESDNFSSTLLAVAVGLAGGVGAILFRLLIERIDGLFFGPGLQALWFLGDYAVIALPTVGLVATAWIVRRWAPEAQGHGVPEVMYAVRKGGGRIRPRVAVVKALASALCIGSGGSVGREGPIVQIGCSLGSSIGQLFGLPDRRLRLMIACGAAAAISGTFGAPIAGVMFAMEIILGNFGARSFGVVVIAAVTSAALVQSVLGPETVFALVEVFQLRSPAELGLYLVLGVLLGLLSVTYVRTLYFFEGLFERWSWNPNLKALIGGLTVGVIGYLGIQLFGGRHLLGVGYDGIERALAVGRDEPGVATLTVTALIALAALKILATSMTLAAGGSGGVFAPALFIGAMSGGAFGVVVGQLFPSVTAPAGAYALVGMAAVFAGSAHAPITSILILFEMTDDYKIILPLMLSTVVSHLIASELFADSIYTIKLRRRGGFTRPPSLSTLDVMMVGDVMTIDAPTVGVEVAVADLATHFHAGEDRSLPVVDAEGRLAGIVTTSDVEKALVDGEVEGLVVADIMTESLITCTPEQTLREMLHQFQSADVRRIPIVASDDPRRLLGVLRRKELLWAYGELATEHRRLIDRSGLELKADGADSLQLEIEIKPEHDGLAFRRLSQVALPEHCLIVLLRRAEEVIIPKGSVVIEPGDTLVALTTRRYERRLRAWIASLDAGE